MSVLFTALCLTAMAASPADDPSFGTDVSIGYSVGNAWAEQISDSRYGNIVFKYDAFVRDRTTSGPRMGMGLWGSFNAGASTEMEKMGDDGRLMRQQTPHNHTGILALLRFDPEAPVTGTFGMGFGRLAFEETPDGSIALPALTIEAGGRHTGPNHSFVDWMLRTHWATHSGASAEVLEDWWFIELNASIGMHLR